MVDFPSHYLPTTIPHICLRSHYKTSAGYKRARNYWHQWNKTQARANAHIFLLLDHSMKMDTLIGIDRGFTWSR